MEEMTITEVLEATAEMLGGIRIRAADAEEIGAPVVRAINNINACLEAIRRADTKKADVGPEKGEV